MNTQTLRIVDVDHAGGIKAQIIEELTFDNTEAFLRFANGKQPDPHPTPARKPTTRRGRTRERVAALVVQGKSNLEMARALGFSTATIVYHLRCLRLETGTVSRADLMAALQERNGD